VLRCYLFLANKRFQNKGNTCFTEKIRRCEFHAFLKRGFFRMVI
jgi:hypothetical protein